MKPQKYQILFSSNKVKLDFLPCFPAITSQKSVTRCSESNPLIFPETETDWTTA